MLPSYELRGMTREDLEERLTALEVRLESRRKRIAELEALLSEAHNSLGEYSEGRFVSNVDELRRRIREALRN